jgi:hypothetical protein
MLTWTQRQRLFNPEYKAREQARQRAYAREHQAERMAYARKWEQQNRERLMGRKKPSICDICGEPSKQICFDHCHTNGHARGWICGRCNLVLGEIADNADLLRKMIAYLTQHSAYQSPQLCLPGL